MAWNINVSSADTLELMSNYLGNMPDFDYFDNFENDADTIKFNIGGTDYPISRITKSNASGILVESSAINNIFTGSQVGKYYYVTSVSGSEETGQTTNGLLQMLKDKSFSIVFSPTLTTQYWFNIYLLELNSGYNLYLQFTATQDTVDGTPEAITEITTNVNIHCLEVKPSYIDEGKIFTYWTGNKAKVASRRMSFSVECYPFTTQGDYTGTNGFEKYYNVSDILLSNEVLINSMDNDFERIVNKYTFPIRTICTDFGELSSNKDQNNVKLTFKLEEKRRS